MRLMTTSSNWLWGTAARRGACELLTETAEAWRSNLEVYLEAAGDFKTSSLMGDKSMFLFTRISPKLGFFLGKVLCTGTGGGCCVSYGLTVIGDGFEACSSHADWYPTSEIDSCGVRTMLVELDEAREPY